MKPVICITEKEYYKAETIFVSSGFKCIPVSSDENILSNAIKQENAFAAIIGVDNYANQLYDSLPKGGIIARFGVGHDGVDKNKALEKGIIVTNTPGVLDDSVAEHAILLIGCFSRNISRHDADMKSNNWKPAIGTELKGKTLLIIGCGPIGKKTAKIASFGFEMNVIGYDVSKLDEKMLKENFGFKTFATNLDDVIKTADYISIHIPSIPSTKHFVNKTFLSKIKSNCVLINTARGPVVDENALYDALKSNQFAGASLDVFEKEPYVPADSTKDLRTLDNVILTPHVGSSTVEACTRMAQSCLKNVKAAYEKQYASLDILNPNVLQNI